jgi:transposase
MLISSQQRIFLAIAPIDFRKGIDGLQAFCRNSLSQDAFSGTVFIFCSKARTSVKLLYYDGNGFWLCQKRFSKGTLAFWPKSAKDAARLRPGEVNIILSQGNPMGCLPEHWSPLA